MTQPERRSRPGGVNHSGAAETFGGVETSVPRPTDLLADVDALAAHLNARLVVQVTVDADLDHRRTTVYRSCSAAERAVKRARQRGQTAHVSLVQMLPVGVVVGLGGGR